MGVSSMPTLSYEVTVGDEIAPVSATPAARYAPVPNPSGRPHPENGNFFWKYYGNQLGRDPNELCPCDHGACCAALLRASCIQGEMVGWATGSKECGDLAGGRWFFCPCCIPCWIQEACVEIEAKIHEFHRSRGDPAANRAVVGKDDPPHQCVAFGFLCGPGALWTMHAQNFLVMKNFQQIQARHMHVRQH